MKQVPLPNPRQDVVPKYSEQQPQQQELQGQPGENKQPGWISVQPNLAPVLEEVTAAQKMGEEMGDNSAESCSLHLHECSWATKADATLGCPVPTATATTVLWGGPHGLPAGPYPMPAPSLPLSILTVKQDGHPAAPSTPLPVSLVATWNCWEGKPTSISSVLLQHPDPLLLCVELLLYEEGAAHIHEAARGLVVPRAWHSLVFWQRVWGLRPPAASGLLQPGGHLSGDIEVLFRLVPGLLRAASRARIPRRKRPAQTQGRRAAVQVVGVPETPVVHAHRVLLAAQPVPAPLGGGSRWHGHAGCPGGPRCRLHSLDGVREMPLSAVPIACSVTGHAPRWRRPGILLLQEVFGELEGNELC